MSVASSHSEFLQDQIARVLGRDEAVSVHQKDLEERAFDWWPVLTKARQQRRIDHRPDMVVMPASTAEVASVLRWAQDNATPVTTRGLGSSVVGGPVPTRGGICLDMTRMDKVLAVNTTDMLVTVEAGKNGGQLEDELAQRGLTLGHSPQSLYRSTVGGWVATRATGQFSSKFGGIEHLVAGFTAVMADGEIVKFGPWPRMAVGPDLRHLVIGSEGCIAVVTDVTLKCFTAPEARKHDTVTFPDLASGIAAMRELMQSRLVPYLLRLYDVTEAKHAMKDPTFSLPVMFVGSEGNLSMVDAEMKCIASIMGRHGGRSIGPAGADAWMSRRFDFSTIERILERPEGVAETIEISHHWSGIEKTYERLTQALAPYASEVLGHFSHAYSDGVSLYVILLGEAKDAASAEARLRQIWHVANQTVLETGAALSHHHGCGLARSHQVSASLGTAFPVWSQIKAAFDPRNILNPGKLGH
jgi:alkyldihydroxyacetonephosphate synthase